MDEGSETGTEVLTNAGLDLHVVHFVDLTGDTGREHDHATRAIDPETRCAAARIRNHQSPLRHLSLNGIARRQIPDAANTKPFAQSLENVLIQLQLQTEEICD